MDQVEVEQMAFDYFESGFHCAEAISAAIVQAQSGVPAPEVVKIAAGFHGGIGGTKKEACGALTGGIIALGHLFGRIQPGEDISSSSQLSVQYREQFIEEFGCSTCEGLLHKLGPQENSLKCKQLTATAAGLLYTLLEEEGRYI